MAFDSTLGETETNFKMYKSDHTLNWAKQIMILLSIIWYQWFVISPSDDMISGSICDEQTHKWFNDHESPSLGLQRGVGTLQRITVDNKYTINWGYGSNQ